MEITDDLLDIMRATFPSNYKKQETLADVLNNPNSLYKLGSLIHKLENVINESYTMVENKELLCDHIKDLIVGVEGQTPEDISNRILLVLNRTDESIQSVNMYLNKILDFLAKTLDQSKDLFIPTTIVPIDREKFKNSLPKKEREFFESVYELQRRTTKDQMSIKQYLFMNKLCLANVNKRFEEIMFTTTIKEEDIDSDLE